MQPNTFQIWNRLYTCILRTISFWYGLYWTNPTNYVNPTTISWFLKSHISLLKREQLRQGFILPFTSPMNEDEIKSLSWATSHTLICIYIDCIPWNENIKYIFVREKERQTETHTHIRYLHCHVQHRKIFKKINCATGYHV